MIFNISCVRFWWGFIARQLLHQDSSKRVLVPTPDCPGGGSPADRTCEGVAARCTNAGKERWFNHPHCPPWCDVAQMEEEIQTLRQVLLVKEKNATDIRRQLGLGPFSHLKQNLSKGWHDVQSSAPWVPCLLDLYCRVHARLRNSTKHFDDLPRLCSSFRYLTASTTLEDIGHSDMWAGLICFAYFDVNLLFLPPCSRVKGSHLRNKWWDFPAQMGLVNSLTTGLAVILPGNSPTRLRPFVVLRLVFSPRRCVRTRASLSHAGQVTSAALSNVGVAITRRLADMRYPLTSEKSQFLYFVLVIADVGAGRGTARKHLKFKTFKTIQ